MAVEEGEAPTTPMTPAAPPRWPGPLLLPQAESLQDALRQLYVLDAIDVNGAITGGAVLLGCWLLRLLQLRLGLSACGRPFHSALATALR